MIKKSIAKCSIALAGFSLTLAYTIFLSIRSAVVVVSSRVSSKSVRPNLDFTLFKKGSALAKNLAQVAFTF